MYNWIYSPEGNYIILTPFTFLKKTKEGIQGKMTGIKLFKYDKKIPRIKIQLNIGGLYHPAIQYDQHL